VQYPGLEGGGALGEASTPGTPAGSIAASAHGGTYSHVAMAAGKGVPPPQPQRRRPAGVARRLREGPSLHRATHLRTAGGAADTAHGRAGGTDCRATKRLQRRRWMASETADKPPQQRQARRHDHPRVIAGASNP